jgi:hypothetical protein
MTPIAQMSTGLPCPFRWKIYNASKRMSAQLLSPQVAYFDVESEPREPCLNEKKGIMSQLRSLTQRLRP